MKKAGIVILALALMLAVLTPAATALASNTPYTNTDQTLIQTQWRAAWQPLGTSTSMDDSGPYYTYTATGNSLHEMTEYEPAVTNQMGGNHVYTLNHATGNYEMHSGIISYTSPYSGLTIDEVWTGYISFDGKPISASNETATAGQLNQWGLVYLPGSTPPSFYPNAVSMGNGYWLVGFSTYTYGSTPAPDTTYPCGGFWTLALNPPHF